MPTARINPLDYRTLQQWVQQVVTHPEGAAAGVNSPDAQSLIPVGLSSVEQVITPSASMTGLERIGVYAEMYFSRLVACLGQDFPAVRHAMGADRFDAIARSYLVDNPSGSPVLHDLGAAFPRFLRDASVFKEQAFVAELARLERATDEIFHDPVHPRLTVDDLLAVPRDRWLEARLLTSPSMRLLSLDYPCNAYLDAVLNQTTPVVPPRARTYVLVHRVEYEIGRVELDELQFRLLSLICKGEPLGVALEQAASNDAELDRVVQEVSRWFEDWSSRTVFTRVEY